MRLFERADLAGPVGRRLDAEQFALHLVGRHRRRIDDDKRAVGAARMFVNKSGRQFLAGAGRPRNEDARIGRANPFDDAAQIVDRGGRANKLVDRPRTGAQVADLALEARSLERPVRDEDQTVRFERFFDEIISAELDRRHGGFDVAVAGNHDDGNVGMLLLDNLQQLQAVQPRTLQPYVEQDQLRATRLDGAKRLVGIARQPRAVTLVRENSRDDFSDVVFVVNNKNVAGHRYNNSRSFTSDRGDDCGGASSPTRGNLNTTWAPRPPSSRGSPSSKSTPPP